MVVIPASARRRYGLEEGEMLVMEESAAGLLLKPVRAYEVEVYTPERQAEFLLSNAVTAAEAAPGAGTNSIRPGR